MRGVWKDDDVFPREPLPALRGNGTPFGAVCATHPGDAVGMLPRSAWLCVEHKCPKRQNHLGLLGAAVSLLAGREGYSGPDPF